MYHNINTIKKQERKKIKKMKAIDKTKKIHINTELLRERIRTLKITDKELAENLGITRQALYTKLNNLTEFKLSEYKKIKNFLQLDEDLTNLIFKI